MAPHFAVVAVVAVEGTTGSAPAAHAAIGKDHGQLEVRRCRATDGPAVLAWPDRKRA